MTINCWPRFAARRCTCLCRWSLHVRDAAVHPWARLGGNLLCLCLIANSFQSSIDCWSRGRLGTCCCYCNYCHGGIPLPVHRLFRDDGCHSEDCPCLSPCCSVHDSSRALLAKSRDLSVNRNRCYKRDQSDATWESFASNPCRSLESLAAADRFPASPDATARLPKT